MSDWLCAPAYLRSGLLSVHSQAKNSRPGWARTLSPNFPSASEVPSSSPLRNFPSCRCRLELQPGPRLCTFLGHLSLLQTVSEQLDSPPKCTLRNRCTECLPCGTVPGPLTPDQNPFPNLLSKLNSSSSSPPSPAHTCTSSHLLFRWWHFISANTTALPQPELRHLLILDSARWQPPGPAARRSASRHLTLLFIPHPCFGLGQWFPSLATQQRPLESLLGIVQSPHLQSSERLTRASADTDELVPRHRVRGPRIQAPSCWAQATYRPLTNVFSHSSSPTLPSHSSQRDL